MEASSGVVVNPDAGFALIVNYLPPSYTDQDLHQLFADVGPLYSAKIMRNKHTNSSFGYGFVNFVQKEDAERAIEVKDGEKVLHKQIRVAFSRRGEGPDAIKNANLFIGNLPLSWKEADLENAFNQHGKVIKCKVLIDQLTGISRGCGFVLYSKTAEAETAIKEIDGQKLPGCDRALLVKRNNLQEEAKFKSSAFPLTGNKSVAKEVHVIHHYSPYPMGYSSQQQQQQPQQQQPVYPSPDKFVHQQHLLPHQVPHPSVDKYPPHAPYGSHVPHGGVDKSPLYFYELPMGGGIPYPAMAQMHPMATLPTVPGLTGGRIGPIPHSQRSSLGPSLQSQGAKGCVSLFVYNVGPECTELDLYQLFGPYGAITNAHIQRDPSSGKSKGFGFVSYGNQEDASRAIAHLHGYAWEKNDYRLLQVSFKREK